MGAENQKMRSAWNVKRKFFCFGCRRSEAEASRNVNRKLSVRITLREAERASVVGILFVLI